MPILAIDFMPFTFAHPAAVLPFSKISKNWVSLTGLVIGSMVPDFEYFIRLRDYGEYGHRVLGIFYFDLPLGIIIFSVYQHIVKNQLIDHLPGWFNQRLSAMRNWQNITYTKRYITVIILSIIAGTCTHLLWDSFTHARGYMVREIPELSDRIATGSHHKPYLYHFLQNISSLIGLVFILISISLMPRRQNTQSGFWKYWLIVTTVMVVVAILRRLSGLTFWEYTHWIVTIISGWLLGILTASAVLPKQYVLPAVQPS